MMNGKLLIGQNWIEATGSFAVDNPATLETIGQAADGTRAQTKAAIEAAHAAGPAWAATPAPERAKILRRIEALMTQHTDELARILTLEGGKPFAEAKGEIGYASSFMTWFAGEAERIYGRMVPASVPNKRLMVLRQPVGVVAAITPWNFPAAMVTRKLAPALAAGCTVVLKPAEQTPFTAIRILELMLEAGVPAGVVNLITSCDPREVGAEMLENPLVRKITFTGSTEVGKYLAQESAKTVKHVSLELGGHAPLIVFEDADLEAAARGALASKFRNAGQTCVCANRLYIHESVQDKFLEIFTPLVQALKVGDGLESGVQIGPLIDAQGLEKVEAQVLEAVGAGAKVIAGGGRPDGLKGRFYQPTILTNVQDSMRIMYEETFGPVAPIISFKTDEEVLRRANDGPFGLAAYFFTQNLSRAWKVAEGLEYGIIGCNDAMPGIAQAPFGGYKESGTGREGGSEGMEAFLETKYVSMGI